MKKTQQTQTLLAELWEDAVFNDSSLKALEDFAKDQAKKQDPTDINSVEISPEVFFTLATSRNRNLITTKEQNKLRNTVVAFFGMSVGSHAATTWMMESRANVVKISDPDIVAATNLNRLKFGWENIGQPKVDLVEADLLTINPFAAIIKTSKTDKATVKKIFDGNPKVDLVVDAIDDIEAKIYLRQLCKERKIPLVSGADVGDGVMLDIERYDSNPQPELFHGLVKGIEQMDFSKMPDVKKKKLIVTLVGFKHNSEAMLNSLGELGKNLGTWPQLGATAVLSGAVVATTIKKIILGENIQSNRYYIDLDQILVKDYLSSQRVRTRRNLIKKVKDELGI